jgi:hypothetical protein
MVVVLARSDLKKMRRGAMDPTGAAKTEQASSLGLLASLLGIFSPAFWMSLGVL